MTTQVYPVHVPEDVGGTPFPDGGEPDDEHRGGADEEFAAVVFDEDFVRGAPIHEPTAVERLLAAAEARAEASEAEARRGRTRRPRSDDDFYDGFEGDGRPSRDQEFDDDLYDPDLLEDGYGRRPRYGAPARWHRPVAWVLALVMGVSMVALAFVAVYRGASAGRQDPAPAPASTGVGKTPDRHGSRSPGHGDSGKGPDDTPSGVSHAAPDALPDGRDARLPVSAAPHRR
jgi:hypothetical protein